MRTALISIAVAVGVWCAYVTVELCRGYRISFYWIPHFSVPPNESSVTRSGLRVTIARVERAGDKIWVWYALEWVPAEPNERTLHLMRPVGEMRVRLWDSDGNEVFAAPGDGGAAAEADSK